MNDYTIANEYTLPSEGKVYDHEISTQFKLRSMTTVEEMKRLNHSEKPNRAICEIIDDCLVEDIGISAYDLCTADFQYMLHKLRIVTYGPEYKLGSRCPWCGSDNTHVVHLESDLLLKPLDMNEFMKYSEFELPVTKHKIKLNMQTPRMMDDAKVASKELLRREPNFVGDPSVLVTLELMIDTIDGEVPPRFKLRPFIEKLPMRDTNFILKSALKLNNLFGLESGLNHTCSRCGLDYTGNFRTTSEFFGPSID